MEIFDSSKNKKKLEELIHMIMKMNLLIELIGFDNTIMVKKLGMRMMTDNIERHHDEDDMKIRLNMAIIMIMIYTGMFLYCR